MIKNYEKYEKYDMGMIKIYEKYEKYGMDVIKNYDSMRSMRSMRWM